MTSGSTTADAAVAAEPGPPPLSRNREYNVLWTANMVSQLGAQGTLIAYPLLVLGLGGSAFEASLAEFAIAGSRALSALPSGALADRVSRKTLMLVSEFGRAVALGLLALLVAVGHAPLAAIVVVAVVEGVCTSLFGTADQALLPSVVPSSQLADAVTRNTARYYLATIVGPGIGGFLYGVQRLLPFVAQAVTSAIAFVTLLFLRLPAPAPAPASSPEDKGKGEGEGGDADRTEGALQAMASGLRWLRGNPAVRATVLFGTAFNLVFSGLLIAVVVMAQQDGRSGAEVGAIGALVGAGGVSGALAAGRLRRSLSPFTALMVLTWATAVLVPLLAVVPTGWPAGLVLGAAAFLAPTATALVAGHQMMVTPDEMRGRLAGLIGVSMGAGAALGPLLCGLLLETVHAVPTVLSCAAAFLLIALGVAVTPAVRAFPALPDNR
ncbi:MFS transporter [Kitasatospora sp. NBC_01300]|uniref:MFS transporter n=1 Tax=Kitasatospora sp. NBC_01300 TaxID=2903574 RepID=UPI00352E86F8|nr:MFS transporter [Kitasatospora sp. NBC_01300]